MNLVNIDNLQTVRNYARSHGNVSPTWIYFLVSQGKMESEIIDGVTFIDKEKYKIIPKAPSKAKRLPAKKHQLHIGKKPKLLKK